MNKTLTIEIVKYIYLNLGIIESDKKIATSILNKKFNLHEKIIIEEDGKEYFNKISGCHIVMANDVLKIITSGGKYDSGITDYFSIFQLNDQQAYACSLTLSEQGQDANVSYYLDGVWIDCSVEQQAKLLLGLEQVKNYAFGWKTCTEYKIQYNLLLSFIKHLTLKENGEDNEGKED